MMVSGKVAFSSVVDTDQWEGKDTGFYSITVALEDEDAETLKSRDVRLKEYEGSYQRKFKSKYPISVIDAEDQEYTKEIPRGSVVRVLFGVADRSHPTWGPSTWATKVRVVEEADRDEYATPEEF